MSIHDRDWYRKEMRDRARQQGHGRPRWWRRRVNLSVVDALWCIVFAFIGGLIVAHKWL